MGTGEQLNVLAAVLDAGREPSLAGQPVDHGWRGEHAHPVLLELAHADVVAGAEGDEPRGRSCHIAPTGRISFLQAS